MRLLIQDISFSYGSHAVLKGVTMEVAPGQVLSIVGPNGSGKSTLLRCLARVLKPQGGAVFLDGREAARIGSRELARLLGQDAICKFLSKRFGASQNEMMQKVKQMTNLEILDNVMEELFVANTMEEVQSIIQDGIKRSFNNEVRS